MTTDFTLTDEEAARVEQGHRAMVRMGDSEPIRMALQVGTTKTANGKTYVLNQNHRWTLRQQKGMFDDRKNFKPESYSHEEFQTLTGEKDAQREASWKKGRQTSMFDTGKKDDLKGQELLFEDEGGAERKSPIDDATTFYKPDVEADSRGDGVTDAARVGVPAWLVPPPPKKIQRLPNLQGESRKAENDFATGFEQNFEQVTQDALKLFKAKAGDGPVVFETDGAKALSPYWNSDSLEADHNKRSENRARLNIALHQTANAITKRAFLTYLNTLPEGSEVMVTVGGCGAGKGYAQKKIPQALELKSRASAVWDSAGDQNATENPWILAECEKRGLTASFMFVHADPMTQWADPDRGVVKRAQDPNDGRMVDAKVFADSYAIGAKNHQAFFKKNQHNPRAKFIFLQNSGPNPKLLPGIPPEALNIDRHQLAAEAVRIVNEREGIPQHVKDGALGGLSIWKD